MKRILFGIVVVLSASCGRNNPVAPTPVAAPPPPVVQACVTNRTGTVSLRNNGSRTVDMIWNGSVRGTVTPGQTLAEFTVAASGPQYIFEAKITNTTSYPCQQLVATPIQCQVNNYATCSGF